MTPGLGHNRGPALDPGTGWHRHCWTQARRALLPRLPLEVIRLRVARARQIGLDYPTYATVRATSGDDIVAFLFSTNALRILAPAAPLPDDRAARLKAIAGCDRILLAVLPLEPAAVARAIETRHGPLIEHAAASPAPLGPWHEIRADMRTALAPTKLPPGGILMIGEAAFERDWASAARLAGFLPAARYFGAPAP